MKIGTKSLLYGAHCFFIHPWFVALGWWKLYGFPCDPRLWVAFFVHDIGYWGMPNIDGEEGKMHPRLGADIMQFLFGWEWWFMCILHSRSIAEYNGLPVSKLCYADKYAAALEPEWLYMMRVIATGEVDEYTDHYVSKRPWFVGHEKSWIRMFWYADMVRSLRKFVLSAPAPK